jgi:hypothetical protein
LIRRMNNIGLILRNIVFILFPVPFLLSFAIEHGGEWAWVAYIAVIALVLAAVAAADRWRVDR